ncbi:MAG: patatin-like phospholipase family protein [Fibrobacter sp.]|nr:patatin-like phospholipase family protein [Fibrobacter sp.]
MPTKFLGISVNGGGALGIGPLAFMCRLEQDLGKKLSDVSVAYAGTSTGAIIAAGLADGLSAHDMFDLYKANLKKIFEKYPWYKRLNLTCPTYNNAHLKKMLQEVFKGKMSDFKKPIFIPATCTNGASVEKVWDLGDKDIDKWFAILSSTAAPTYFDCVYNGKDCYIDGGMWKNCPIDVLNAGLKNSEYRDRLKILSFNTGLDTPNVESGNKTLIGWGKYILSDWVARAGKSGDYEVMADLGKENVAVASPKNDKKIPMDDTSDETIEYVCNLWNTYYDENKSKFIDFIKA